MDTNKEYLLSAPLEVKVAHTIDTIASFIKQYGDAYISFSGGKDSTVLLDIARRFVDRDIPAVFCNTGNEYPEIVKFARSTPNVTELHPTKRIKQVIEEYGFPLISKEVSRAISDIRRNPTSASSLVRLSDTSKFRLADKWRYLIDAPFSCSDKCCYYLKKSPLHKWGKDNKRNPIIGTMASESRMRKSKWLREGCIVGGSSPKCMPLSVWSDDDIWAYIRHNNIPYCEIYDRPGVTRTGCMFCGFGIQYDPERFNKIKDYYPRMYKTISSLSNNGVSYEDAIEFALKQL